jgi:uncharacterized membrane protein YeaQ/YmgE (transglycosylase-associated protein family)
VTSFLGISISSALLRWILIGFLAGWVAGLVSRGAGFGCLGDVVVGVIGSILGGTIFPKLGIFGNGLIYSVAEATVGAVVLLAVARLFSGGRHSG